MQKFSTNITIRETSIPFVTLQELFEHPTHHYDQVDSLHAQLISNIILEQQHLLQQQIDPNRNQEEQTSLGSRLPEPNGVNTILQVSPSMQFQLSTQRAQST